MNYDPRAAGSLCDACPLRHKKPVPPNGPHDPDIVIVGEGPGQHEERRGRAFVGPSGILLDDILRAVGQRRDRAWITNAILCRAETPGVSGAKRYDVKTYLAWLKLQNAHAKKLAKANKQPFEPVPTPFQCCAPRLWAELGHFENVARARGDANGLVVVPTGNFASKLITGRNVGIQKLRGSPIPLERADS